MLPTIAAADAAAARGLWVAGFVAYEAAPGIDPALTVRAREPDDPLLRFPLAWFAMFERREETVLPSPRDDQPETAGSRPGALRRSRPLRRRDRTDPRAHRGRGHLSGEPHAAAPTRPFEGDERGLYRDLCFAQRGAHAAYLNTGRYRILSASPELFFRIDGDRLTTRPMKGTAPRGRWLARGRGDPRRASPPPSRTAPRTR